MLAQVQGLDSSLEKAVEAYDLATVKLAGIDRDLKQNARELVLARRNLRRGQAALSSRLVTLYTSSESDSTIEVLLGSANLNDLLNRLDTANRVSDQDVRIVKQIVQFRDEVRRHEAELKRARAEQAQVVADRAAQRASIQSQLAQRRQLLSSIRGEIAQLQAQERSRQLELVRQAQARVVAQQQQAATQVISSAVAAPSTPLAQAIAAPPPSQYGGVVGVAMRYLGTPYVWGGSSPSGFDCSGFVMYVFAQVGVSLPHNAAAQYGVGVPVSADQLEPGDIVFFDGLGHDGIYIGGGQFIHSPHTGDVVKISSLSESWYASTFVGARRVV